MCLKWAEESDLDVAAITKTVVENIRNRNVPSLDVCLSLPMSTAISEVIFQIFCYFNFAEVIFQSLCLF